MFQKADLGNYESSGGRQRKEFNMLAQESRGKVMEGLTLVWKRKYKKENNLIESEVGCIWSVSFSPDGHN